MLVEKIKELCVSRGITIKELERTAGLGNGTIRRWDDSSPALEKVIKVADYFGVSVEDLLKEKQPVDIQAFAENKNKPSDIGELSDAELSLIQLFRALPEERRGMVLPMLVAVLKAAGLSQEQE